MIVEGADGPDWWDARTSSTDFSKRLTEDDATQSIVRIEVVGQIKFRRGRQHELICAVSSLPLKVNFDVNIYINTSMMTSFT
jgi:hypothetical protein